MAPFAFAVWKSRSLCIFSFKALSALCECISEIIPCIPQPVILMQSTVSEGCLHVSISPFVCVSDAASDGTHWVVFDFLWAPLWSSHSCNSLGVGKKITLTRLCISKLKQIQEGGELYPDSPRPFARIKCIYILMFRKAPLAWFSVFLPSSPILSQKGWNDCINLVAQPFSVQLD